MSRGAPDRGEDGFSLVECLVALVVLAMAFAALYRGLDGSFRGVRSAEQQKRAVSLARNLLASAGVEWTLEPGRRTGTEGGLTWSVEISSHHGPGDRSSSLTPLKQSPFRPVPYRIDVAVAPAGTHSVEPLVTLTTLRLGVEQ